MSIEVRQVGETNEFEVTVDFPVKVLDVVRGDRRVYIRVKTDQYERAINMSATGDVAPNEVESLIEAIRLAASISSGRIKFNAS